MAGVTLAGVDKRYGRVHAVETVDLEIADGEFCVLVGPSGCGKTTVLRLIAGLEEPDRGAVLIGGRDVTRVPPAQRGVAMVFQSYALYPHMTAAENIIFGLRNTGTGRREAEERLALAASMLRLEGLLERKPAQLSGGERQRVAIGRAIVREPSVFLFDEPLSNLDAALRTHMRIEIGRIHQTLQTTMVYVTHDQVEAMTMAERIVVLDAGRVEQTGPPLELYRRPATRFVAGFLGSPPMNFVEATVETVEDGILRLALPGGADLALARRDPDVAPGEALTLGIRPEDLFLGEGAALTLPSIVRLVEPLGAETVAHVETVTGAWLVLRLPGSATLRTGEIVRVGLTASACHLFRADGRALDTPVG